MPLFYDKLISMQGNDFLIQCPGWDRSRARMIPSHKVLPKDQGFLAPNIKQVREAIKRLYRAEEITEEAQEALRERAQTQGRFPAWFRFKNPPRAHQKAALDFMWDKSESALFMDMRTGKTYVSINYAAALAQEGKIQGVVAICPDTIKSVWEDELADHCPIDYWVHLVEPTNHKKTEEFIQAPFEGLKVLVVGMRALSKGRAIDHAIDFSVKHATFTVVDESSLIKNPKAKMVKNIFTLGGLAEYRAILTGTEITKGIVDLFAQFRFLNWKIIGCNKFSVFKMRYCETDECGNVVGYRNVLELFDALEPYVFRVKLSDIQDMPERVNRRIRIAPTREQKKALEELNNAFTEELKIAGEQLSVTNVLTRLLRMAQVSGGFLPYETEAGTWKVKPLPGGNPKLEALFDIIETAPEEKIIIWARFRAEIEAIERELTRRYGRGSAVTYYGGLTNAEQRARKNAFQDGNARFFVANPQSGSMGLELSAASVHVFYSNSFSYTDRIQAEARTNSSKQKATSILYVDLELDAPIDHMLRESLETKQSMAQYVQARLQGVNGAAVEAALERLEAELDGGA